MYKVLDVREYQSINKGRLSTSLNSNTGTLLVDQTDCVVVICQDTETTKRHRFTFHEGYEDDFFGKTRYCGYKGDFALLVQGDSFVIKETSTYKYVELLNT